MRTLRKDQQPGGAASAKGALTVMDKFSPGPLRPPEPDSLVSWAGLYFQIHVQGSPRKTQVAKKQDLARFLSFYQQALGHERVDGWTPAVTKHFQKQLQQSIASQTGAPLKATTVNRVLATVRHFGRWLHNQRPLPAGNPLHGVKDLQVEEPDWNGLTPTQIMRLKSAGEQRLQACQRVDQNPLLETTVFQVLLHTGLRESELCSLDRRQYHHRGFHQVLRKGHRISEKVPVPAEAREFLDRYLADRPPGGALLVSRYGRRLAPQDVARICQRLSEQACAHLPAAEKFKLNPHMLRHTFLKRVADKHGVHVAQKMSGNISMQEIFRYAQPSQAEMDDTAEKVFD